MYLIVEKSRGRLYAYREDAAHFKAAEKERHDLKKLTPKILDDECDLSDFPNNAYVRFKLASKPTKKPTKKTKKKSRAT